VTKTGETRLPLLTLGYAAAYAESTLDHIHRRFTSSPALAAHWLAVVAELSYPLTDVEQQAAVAARRQLEEDAAADRCGAQNRGGDRAEPLIPFVGIAFL
jgi:hypothetical protein